MKLLFVSALLLLSGWAQAQGQTVWRCGPDGRVYSDSPCAQGRQLEVGDARSAEAQAAGRAVVAADRRLAAQMTAEREQRERARRAEGSGLAAIVTTGMLSPADAKSTAKNPSKSKAAKKEKSTKTGKKAKAATAEKAIQPPQQSAPPAAAGTSRTAARAFRQTPG